MNPSAATRHTPSRVVFSKRPPSRLLFCGVSKKVPRRKAKADALSALRGGIQAVTWTPTTLVNVTIGGQNFSLVIDSGSSDTWVPQAGFFLFQSYQQSGTADDLNQTYGTSEYVAGPIALETVSIGGLEVSRQVVPIPDVAAWTGDGVLSGVLGLAFPNVTVFSTPPTQLRRLRKNRILYDPFFFTAVKQKKPTPPTIAESKWQFFWYALPIDSYNFPGSENIPEARNASLGNDTAVNLVPAPVAAGYAAAFDPPAELVTAFSMDPRDQLVPFGNDTQGDVTCVLGTQAQGGPDIASDFHLLGDTFLRNVVATFNPIGREITLTQRVAY
ncbi:acid protease [Mycena olivaceomarginata]|nr:acid protease [Mycena olivaceomarginata]